MNDAPEHRSVAGALAQPVSRRRFVQGLAMSGAAVSLGVPGAWAAGPASPLAPAVLTGSDIALRIGSQAVNLTGRAATAVTVNGSLPAPVLRLREGDHVTLRVRNTLPVTSSIHWHGLLLPATMDGVPGLSFDGIAPGETYDYHFPLRQHGTYWYHGHSAMQEQLGLYGALIIDPAGPELHRYQRDHVVLLSDWTDRDPHHLLDRLRKQGDYFNHGQRTLVDLFREARRDGWRAALADRAAWGEMRMNPTDLADVSAAAYTYLINGSTPAGNWTGLFAPGETVRLRFINGAAMTYFDVRIPGLRMTVIAADGQPVQPVEIEEFRLGVAETLDVLVRPGDLQAYTIFARNMDRSGYARATLATRAGLAAAVPAVDPRPLLTMTDMGHGSHGDHAGHAAPVPAAGHTGHSGHDMHAGHGGHDAHAGHEDHSGHAAPVAAVPAMQTHPASERNNPGVDMQAEMPAPRLDDPGIGLRGNGRRVLTYADLRSTFADPDGRAPGRDIELHLTGHMERYVWSFNGIRFNEAEPLVMRLGERLRITLVNDTMMEHPIHLHGMWSDLEDADGRFQVRKHTISMPPGTRRSFRVTADAPGRWAFHCHLLFHMESGMFREVHVIEAEGST
nr:copper resistance system multicopper oxidase [Perlucidibaca piscinae]